MTSILLSIVLSLASSGTWLDVPFVAQPKDGCGSAVIAMLLQYWKAADPPAVEVIHRVVFTPSAGGVFASDMQKYFEAHAFQTTAFEGTWSDIESNVAAGRPLIVCLESSTRGTLLHYVVVAGFDDESGSVWINDPADRKLRLIDRRAFEQRWKSTDNWTLLVTPSFPAVVGPAAPSTATITTTADLETASEAFRREDYRTALHLARLQEKSHPEDPLLNQMLGTLYLLQQNLPAALKYWNRVNQPMIREFSITPAPPVNPVAMDRATTFARGEILRLDQFEETERRLDADRIYNAYSFDLEPADGDAFNLQMRGNPRRPGVWSWFGGVPYETVQPRLANLGHQPVDVDSLLRWDRFKRRASADLSGPAGSGGIVRYRVSSDLRDESWNRNGLIFPLRKAEIGAALEFAAGPRWSWTSGAFLTNRTIGDGAELNGTSIKYDGRWTYDVLRIPEQRLQVSTGIDLQAGRFLTNSDRFAKLQPAIRLNWFPEVKGSDYETAVSVRNGMTAGQTPLDEQFVVGLDRDSDLRLRAHPATIDGRKGVAPLGPRYFLINADIQKNIRQFGLIRMAVAPFIDVARVSQWYVDSGLELRFNALSLLNFTFSLGCDMKTGRITGFGEVK